MRTRTAGALPTHSPRNAGMDRSDLPTRLRHPQPVGVLEYAGTLSTGAGAHLAGPNARSVDLAPPRVALPGLLHAFPHHGAHRAGLQRGANKTPNGTGPDSSEAQNKTTARRRVAATICFASQALQDDLLCMKLNKAPSPVFPHPLTHTRASDMPGPGSLPSSVSPLWETQKGAHRVRHAGDRDGGPGRESDVERL
jgi:hypothetical protein